MVDRATHEKFKNQVKDVYRHAISEAMEKVEKSVKKQLEPMKDLYRKMGEHEDMELTEYKELDYAWEQLVIEGGHAAQQAVFGCSTQED